MKKLLHILAPVALILPGAASAQATIDPALETAAQQTVDHVFPAGTYARMMDGTMTSVMDGIMAQIGDMPIAQLARMGGMSEEETAKLGEGRLNEIMAIYDPDYEERMSLTTETMFSAMGGVMGKLEPEMRAGLVEAYANRFTMAELNELNAFFTTPAGAHYARESMMIFLDPAVMAKMQNMGPVLMEEMPGIMEKVTQATAHLPEPRKKEDLSEEELARIEQLFGKSEN